MESRGLIHSKHTPQAGAMRDFERRPGFGHSLKRLASFPVSLPASESEALVGQADTCATTGSSTWLEMK